MATARDMTKGKPMPDLTRAEQAAGVRLEKTRQYDVERSRLETEVGSMDPSDAALWKHDLANEEADAMRDELLAVIVRLAEDHTTVMADYIHEVERVRKAEAERDKTLELMGRQQRKLVQAEADLAAAREQLRLANIDWANTEAEAATLRRMLDALYDIFMEGVEPEEPEEYRILMMLRARAEAKDGDA